MERACRRLPRSYKLWKMYLEGRVKHVSHMNAAVSIQEYDKVNILFEQALLLLSKMPRLWEMYLKFLMVQPYVRITRRKFDSALRALACTHHGRIWALYWRYCSLVGGGTAVKVWRRSLQYHSDHQERYGNVLQRAGMYTEASQNKIDILDRPGLASGHEKSQFDIWSDLVNLLITNATLIDFEFESGLHVDQILRSGIARFPDQAGHLWCGLANYWIQRGNLIRGRDVLEEAITVVMTVRDFTLVFDTYAEFEESVIENLMAMAASQSADVSNLSADSELDIGMMRFEYLMDRRSFLLNDVYLRQNPHNVLEWEKRVALWGENTHEAVRTYTKALSVIDADRAFGPLHRLWVGYAKLYERAGDVRNARIVMEKAVKVRYKTVGELCDIWIERAELELRNGSFDEAVQLLSRALDAPQQSAVDFHDERLSPQQRIHKSWKLWSFYIDLVESVGTLEETRLVYERVFELRIATPQTIVNLANLLEENGYHEDCFKVYEKGLDLFSYPVAFEIWNIYLTKAVDRRIEIERLRDLFEQAVEDCPPRFARVLYLMYGNLEEERGLSRHAMRIYERATRAVADEDRADMFNLYITKSASNFGLSSTRPIYERAITALPDGESRTMCMKFADMEKRLGEIDRARAIYGHASQLCDPRLFPDFWSTWENFELQHGNEDTYKEMLRVKRSIQAQYNTDVNFIASQALARGHKGTYEIDRKGI
jgi:pre-mRNA-splicing factor SYF1